MLSCLKGLFGQNPVEISKASFAFARNSIVLRGKFELQYRESDSNPRFLRTAPRVIALHLIYSLFKFKYHKMYVSIISYHIISYHIILYHTMLFYLILFCRILYYIMLYHIISYHIMLCYIISCYIGNYQPISLHHLSSILITTHHNRYTVFAEKHGAPIHTEGSHPPIMRAAKIARAEKPAKKAARWPDCKILQSSYYLPVSWWKRKGRAPGYRDADMQRAVLQKNGYHSISKRTWYLIYNSCTKH